MTEPRVVARYVDGRYVCGWTTDGRDFRRIGCAHVAPSSAIAHRTNFDPYVSPLSGVGSTSRSVCPQPGRELMDPTPDSGSAVAATARTRK